MRCFTRLVSLLTCVGLTAGTTAAAISGWLWFAPRSGAGHGSRVVVPAQYGVHGIDVSHHQGAIDWDEVARSGRVDFVFVKATEGDGWTDKRFAENWTGARDAGLEVGAYHYFKMCRTGQSQVDHFTDVVPRAWGALPPVVDVEVDSRCNGRPNKAALNRELAVWLDVAEAHYGQRPLIYASSAFAHRWLDLDALQAGLWIAAYTRGPSDATPWLYWQHSDRGAVPGIEGRVDLNVRRTSRGG
jgi:lysozyme